MLEIELPVTSLFWQLIVMNKLANNLISESDLNTRIGNSSEFCLWASYRSG